MQVLNDAWNEILLSNAQWIFRVLLYDRYILCCSDRAETPPTAAAALPCTPAWILCRMSCHLLLLHSLLWAHTSGSQLSPFSQGVNRKHFPCHGSRFGKQKKKVTDLTEFLNSHILFGTSEIQAWLFVHGSPAFCTFNNSENTACWSWTEMN